MAHAPILPPDSSTSEWPALLAGACAGENLSVVYQPIVDVARGVVVGYEALSRFTGSSVTNPEVWFAEAAAHGFGAALQAAAIRMALAAREQLPPDCFLTVNVGPEVLASPEVRAVWTDAGDLRGVFVELTEHVAVADYTAMQPDLDRLRAAGADIAVDDAGTGYAGLAHLLAVRPSLIKLDRALVTDVDRDEAKRALIELVGAFAARIDAWVLAEGIERAGELAALAAMGVPLAQGYYLGRPAQPWQPVSVDAQLTMLGAPREESAEPALLGLREPALAVTDPDLVAGAFADPDVDIVVLCDTNNRPIAAITDRDPLARIVMQEPTYHVDTPIRDAALRAVTRRGADWSNPLLCTNTQGHFVGVVRVPHLMRALASA